MGSRVFLFSSPSSSIWVSLYTYFGIISFALPVCKCQPFEAKISFICFTLASEEERKRNYGWESCDSICFLYYVRLLSLQSDGMWWKTQHFMKWKYQTQSLGLFVFLNVCVCAFASQFSFIFVSIIPITTTSTFSSSIHFWPTAPCLGRYSYDNDREKSCKCPGKIYCVDKMNITFI